MASPRPPFSSENRLGSFPQRVLSSTAFLQGQRPRLASFQACDASAQNYKRRRLYGVRFSLENADILQRDLSWFFVQRQIIEKLAPLNREKFFKRGLRLFGETIAPIWDWSLISGRIRPRLIYGASSSAASNRPQHLTILYDI